MVGASAFEPESVVVVNVVLLTLALVLPALLIAYVMHARRRLSPDFSLRRLEAIELDRAEQLYRNISQRLTEIDRLARSETGSLWHRLRHRAQVRRDHSAELDDLRTGAAHLRASITRLRRRPIRRLRYWVHAISWRFAISGSLATYLTLLVPATVFIYFAEQPAWAREIASTLENALLWTPVDERLLYVNAITAALAMVLAPVLYSGRRAKLYSDHRTQTRALVDFALADPDRLADESAATAFFVEDPLSIVPDLTDSWSSILGISPAATADEVREAYRLKIKQMHPDRVQGLAPAFRNLAELETKKLNVAYEQALAAAKAG
jgi:hypothetical protein